ncbi:hypothetical protein GUJ93_ZPchr0001g29238 [Zizania palustris]|uniref:Uncharacterized protein n=1 Tax=Zizania palustris TaxID=103762 RepID=A0A8J5RRQ1_ZIZPA|nr:hypothetical protein GUJ93_ZPchr0001g29238 [Zizania palustris]
MACRMCGVACRGGTDAASCDCEAREVAGGSEREAGEQCSGGTDYRAGLADVQVAETEHVTLPEVCGSASEIFGLLLQPRSSLTLSRTPPSVFVFLVNFSCRARRMISYTTHRHQFSMQSVPYRLHDR